MAAPAHTTLEENSYTEEHLSRPPELPITDNMKKHDGQPCKLPQADEKAEVCTYACNIDIQCRTKIKAGNIICHKIQEKCQT